MVIGDVNGDGYSNDRAFIFDPASVSDPAMAAAMNRLADSPELVAQLGAQARTFAGGFTWERAADETERHLATVIRL